MRLGTETIDEYIKEFKGICDDFATIHNSVDEDRKMINFSRGLGHNYKTFRTVMLVKKPYPTFNQFVNALRGFNMREDETTNREEEIITSIQDKESSILQDKKHVFITTKMDQVLRRVYQVKVMKGTIMTRVKFVL